MVPERYPPLGLRTFALPLVLLSLHVVLFLLYFQLILFDLSGVQRYLALHVFSPSLHFLLLRLFFYYLLLLLLG